MLIPQLKDIGRIGDFAKNVKSITDISSDAGGDELVKIIDSMDDLDDVGKMFSMSKVSKEIGESALATSKFAGEVESCSKVTAGLAKEGTTGIAGLGMAFKGLGTTLAPIAPLLGGIVAVAVGGMIFDTLYTSIDEATEKSSKSATSAAEAKSDLESTRSELENINSQIEEIQAKGTLTISDKDDLASLQQQSAELQKQLDIKTALAENEIKQASKDAEAALTNTDVLDETNLYDMYGNRKANGTTKKGTLAESLSSNTQKVRDYEKAIDDLQSKQRTESLQGNPDVKKIEQWQGSIDLIQASIDKINTDSASKAELIQANLSQITDKSSEAYKLSSDALNDYLNINKTTSQIIGDAFSDGQRSGVKSYLEDLAKSGKSASEITRAMRGIGLTSDDFGGTALRDVAKYFADAATEAENLATATESVGNTVGDIEIALGQGNPSDFLKSYTDYLTTAQDLSAKGLTGTDDYETIANTIGTSRNTDATARLAENKANIQANIDKIHEFMDWNVDEEAFEITTNGVQRFSDAFNGTLQQNIENTGKAFETTGEAAMAMGVSTSTFESFMDAMSDYDIDNSGIGGLIKSSERLSEAQSAFDGIKELYDSMDGNDPSKGKLKATIDEWTPILADAEAGLAEIPEEKITKLKFEYDQTQLQKYNDDLRSKSSSASITSKRDNYSDILGNNKEMISSKVSEVGNDVVVKVDADTSGIKQKMDDAEKDLNNLVASNADDELVVNAQIKLDEAEQEYYDALDSMSKNGKVEVKTEAKNDGSSLSGNTTETVHVVADWSEVEEMQKQLQVGQTMTFTANVEGVEQEVKSFRDETGVIHYSVTGIDGIEKEVAPAATVDGTIFYEGVYNDIGQAPDQNATAKYDGDYSGTGEAPDKDATANYGGDFTGIGSPPTLSGVVNYVANFIGKAADIVGGFFSYNGTANPYGASFLEGTAFASGVVNGTIPKNVFSDEKYRTHKDQLALTGELGTEMVV